jgi:hypothetical protein
VDGDASDAVVTEYTISMCGLFNCVIACVYAISDESGGALFVDWNGDVRVGILCRGKT